MKHAIGLILAFTFFFCISAGTSIYNGHQNKEITENDYETILANIHPEDRALCSYIKYAMKDRKISIREQATFKFYLNVQRQDEYNKHFEKLKNKSIQAINDKIELADCYEWME